MTACYLMLSMGADYRDFDVRATPDLLEAHTCQPAVDFGPCRLAAVAKTELPLWILLGAVSRDATQNCHPQSR